MRPDEQQPQPSANPRPEEKDDSQSSSYSGQTMGGYPLKELAKAPSKPPNPHRRQPEKTPAELIDDTVQHMQESPARKNIVVAKAGLGVLIVAAVLGVIFMQASVFILLGIVGFTLLLIGMFLKL